MSAVIRLVALVLLAALACASATRAQSTTPDICLGIFDVDPAARPSPDIAEGQKNAALVLKKCGFALMDQSEWARAIRFFALSIKNDPGDGDAYYGRALAREKIGDKTGADIDMAISRSSGR